MPSFSATPGRLPTLLAALTLALVFAPAATAQSVIYVDSSATGADDGSSWANAHPTLQAALARATGTDQIWIAEGTYYPDEGPGVTDDDRTAAFRITGAQDSLTVYGGFGGGESSPDARDPAAHPVVLSGDIDQNDAPFAPTEDTDSTPSTPSGTDHINGDNSFHVLYVDGVRAGDVTGATLVEGITIRSGQANGGEGGLPNDRSGGGVFLYADAVDARCSPTLTQVRIEGNSATSRGGGLMVDGNDGGESTPTIYNALFLGNSSQTGGAINAYASDGGVSSPRISASLFRHNTVSFHGGAINLQVGEAGTVAATVVNSVFADNAAGADGGAVKTDAVGNSNSSVELTALNSTFVRNAAENGGAIFNLKRFSGGTATTTLTNTLIWNNTAPDGAQLFNRGDGAEIIIDHTLLAGGVNDITIENSATTTNNGGILSDDPRFVNSADLTGVDDTFGTPDDGLRLVPSSPAEDAGSPSALPPDVLDLDDDNNTSEALPVDLTGQARVQDTTLDIGAYEGGTPALAIDAFAPGAAAPGEAVTIIGTRLANTDRVTLDGVPAPITAASSTEVTVTVPDGATTGLLQLTMNGQTVNSNADVGVVDAPYGAEQALVLDGAQDGSAAYVQAPTGALDATAPFTVEAWIQWDGSSGFRTVLSKPQEADTPGVSVVVNDGLLQADIVTASDGTREIVHDGHPLPPNEWIHVAVAYDGTNQSLYLNGARVRTINHGSVAVPVASTEPFLIGRSVLPGSLDNRTFPGQVDQVRTWSTALSPEQVHARMHQTIHPDAPAASALVASYRFDAGTGPVAFDYVGRYSGTLENGRTRTPVSAARLGQESAVATSASDASVGPANAALSATNIASDDTVQVYRYGTADRPRRTGSDIGDDLSALVLTDRAALTWGVSTPGLASPAADLTISYGGVNGLSNTVALLRRDAPGAPWARAAGWTHDPAGHTFTMSGPVQPGEYAVATRPTLYVAPDGNDANGGESWAEAFGTLTRALDEATGGDQIWIAEGTYRPDEGPGVTTGDRTAAFTIGDAQSGLRVYGGFAGTEDRLDARDPRAHPVILSGDIGTAGDASDNSYTVVYLNGLLRADTTRLDGLTIRDGNANGPESQSDRAQQGGGLYCDGTDGAECSPVLSNLRVLENQSASWGAGLMADAVSGVVRPHIVNSVFARNGSAFPGGALFVKGGAGDARPTLHNTLIANNEASDGAGLYLRRVGRTELVNVSLVGNRASDSGNGLYVFDTSGDGIRITNSILQNGGDELAKDNGSVSIETTLVEGGCPSGAGCRGVVTGPPAFVDAADPDGDDDAFGTPDDGLRLLAGSPALNAGDDQALPADGLDLDGDADTSERLPLDLAGTNRVQDGAVDLGPYEGAVASVALTDGSANGLGFAPAVSPGTNDNPVGAFALSATASGATLNELTVTNRAAGVRGIRAVRLYWSTDRTLEPGSDPVLGAVSVDADNAPATVTFSGLGRTVPTATGYAILAIDVAASATASGVQFALAQPSALSFTSGLLATVNGAARSDSADLPLSNTTTALPVALTAFNGTARPEGVRLTWTTAAETNNAGFAVQRQITRSGTASRQTAAVGGDVWQTVGTVDGNGTTTAAQAYRFTDEDLPYTADSLSYRLRQIDTDGSASFSDEITVARGAVDEIQLLGPFPNPARQHVTVRFAVPGEAAAETARLRLYDVMGRQVRTVQSSAKAGRHELRLGTAQLASGVYFLRLRVGSTVKTQKLTVVR